MKQTNFKIKQSINRKHTKRLLLLLVLVSLLSAGVYTYAQTRKNAASSDVSTGDTRQSEEVTSDDPSGQQPANQDPTSQNIPEGTKPNILDYRLLVENEQFKIRELNNSYLITLYAIINRPEQADSYRDQLKEFKYNALDYLKARNIDVNTVKIEYEPAEAQNL